MCVLSVSFVTTITISVGFRLCFVFPFRSVRWFTGVLSRLVRVCTLSLLLLLTPGLCWYLDSFYWHFSPHSLLGHYSVKKLFLLEFSFFVVLRVSFGLWFVICLLLCCICVVTLFNAVWFYTLVVIFVRFPYLPSSKRTGFQFLLSYLI